MQFIIIWFKVALQHEYLKNVFNLEKQIRMQRELTMIYIWWWWNVFGFYDESCSETSSVTFFIASSMSQTIMLSFDLDALVFWCLTIFRCWGWPCSYCCPLWIAEITKIWNINFYKTFCFQRISSVFRKAKSIFKQSSD